MGMCGSENPAYKHGHRINGKITKEYQSWQMMKTRCYNKNRKDYKYYGGKGIKVCDRWLEDFQNFLEDMGERHKNCTLDRIDNNSNYNPSNCRWVNNYVQKRNRSDNLYITYKGITKIQSDWAKELHVSLETIFYWYKKEGRLDTIIRKYPNGKNNKKII